MKINILQFKHDKNLDYRSIRNSKYLTTSIPVCVDTIFSFDLLCGDKYQMKSVDALSLREKIESQKFSNVAIVNVKSRSPLYPILYWYVLHNCHVGYFVYLYEDSSSSTPLDLDYFKSCFRLIEDEGGWKKYEKIEKLIVEKDKGLDEWTFGIPVGPGDASMLNTLVSRIKKLGIPKYEIILCGNPGEGFQYAQDVDIVGENIPAPPVHITRKKNLLADSAKYKNLCILHDRVLLPENFYEAAKKFGDHFSFYTFHSVYFMDKLGMQPVRYSDYNNLKNDPASVGLARNDSNYKYINSRSDFIYANPKRYSVKSYVTGSIYICKTELWKYVKQDERLFWSEFEDVEFGIRCNDMGIPHIINPYSITTSMRARTTVLNNGSILFENHKGKTSFSIRNLLLSKLLPQRSISELTVDNIVDRYQEFCSLYNIQVPVGNLNGSISKFQTFCNIISELEIERTKPFAIRLYRNICKYLVVEQVIPNEEENFISLICSNINDQDLKLALVQHVGQLRNQIYLSFFNRFYKKYESDEKFIPIPCALQIAAKKILKEKSLDIEISHRDMVQVLKCFMRDINGN